MKFKITAVLFSAVVPALFAGSYTGDVELISDSFFSKYISNRLSVGVSYASASMKELTTPHENAYLGNLDTLRENDTGAFGIVIRYDFCDYVGVEFSNDFRADLDAYNYGDESCDGTLELSGHRFQLNLQYPFELGALGDFAEGQFIVPYVGIGFYDVSASWSHANWWHWGWSSPDSYDRFAGGVQAPHKGYSRWMVPEDPGNATEITIGVGFKLFDHAGLDVFYRRIDIDDVEAEFHRNSATGHLMREGSFPAACSQFGVMLRYIF